MHVVLVLDSSRDGIILIMLEKNDIYELNRLYINLKYYTQCIIFKLKPKSDGVMRLRYENNQKT